jgi:Protein of unknown function (DUF2846)
MKSVLVLMLLTLSALAQQEPMPAAAAACGPGKVKFDVKLDETQYTLAEPEAGKALVYFVQDVGAVNCIGACFETRIGLDGTWVGAVQHNSYFSVSVEPGEHHVCASPELKFFSAASQKFVSSRLALAHFTVEAGRVYYFRARSFGSQNERIFEMDAVDADQAKYLIASYPLSISHPKP